MNPELFENVLNKAQNFLKQRGIEIVSEKTLMASVPFIIECVETFKDTGITGEDKKSLALRVLLFIVKESSIDDEKKNVLRELIEGGALEMTIDIIVDASKGKFELNRKTRRKLFVCMSQCFDTLATHASNVHIHRPHLRAAVAEEAVVEEAVAEEAVAEEALPEIPVAEEAVAEEALPEIPVAEEAVAAEEALPEVFEEEEATKNIITTKSSMV
jgi:hypothetical protein